MLCDIIIAGEKAKFGQLEINLGIIPGGGATQKLTHAVGKSRAMQICLTGEMITAQQAVSWGLVNSVHPPEKVIDAAVEIGNQITRQSKIITRMVKESINNAFELTLQEGLEAEYRISYSTYATDDIKEGMQAFIEKRKPSFTINKSYL
ncbi:putative enoyl-CoA hydratase, mitochondrial [Armadillidium vulgare]|nr:putative enoyl-CoA hydratase, mitochondrial [Armadillidium vulgare]